VETVSRVITLLRPSIASEPPALCPAPGWRAVSRPSAAGPCSLLARFIKHQQDLLTVTKFTPSCRPGQSGRICDAASPAVSSKLANESRGIDR